MRTRTKRTWSTGARPDTSGARAYTILIRAPWEDMDTRGRNAGGGAKGTEGAAKAKAVSPDAWYPALHALFAGDARLTFNQVCVTVAGRTADLMFKGGLEEAVWRLVEERMLEHTMRAPILFRRRVEAT